MCCMKSTGQKDTRLYYKEKNEIRCETLGRHDLYFSVYKKNVIDYSHDDHNQ